MKSNLLKKTLALLLCCAMLLPNLSPLANAAAILWDSQQSDQEAEKPWEPVVPTDIPEYNTAGGSVSKELVCDDGNSLTQDKAKSYFRMVTGTTLAEFNAYLAKLTDAGFTKTAENALPGKTTGTQNVTTRWLSPKEDYVLTVYFTPGYGEVKIVADTAEDAVKTYSAGYRYEGGEAETSVMMTMYGLSMADNGFDTTSTLSEYDVKQRNCGALIIIRMPDNSLFVNDGGDLHQWSDEVCEDFLDFCRKITGTGAGEKVVFNTWFVSHSHTDHFGGLPRFVDRYNDAIDIKNVMYSLDDENIGSTRDMTPVMKMIKAYYPNVKYYKPHTGEKLYVNGVEFDVLYTQEDRFYPASDGTLNVGDTRLKTRDGGTYRECLWELEEAGPGQYDYNDTSTVLKVTFPHEVTGQARDYTSILYADVNWGDQILVDMYPASVLQNDIMMVPHHGHDTHPDLVAMSGANIFLYTQDKNAIYGPNGVVDYKKNSDGSFTHMAVDATGTYRPALVNDFLAMHDPEGEKYFETTATRKTYWEGTETAVIFFGEDAAFPEAEALGLSRDSEDPAGYTVYTGKAPDFPYEGWSLFSDVIGTDYADTTDVTLTTPLFRGHGVELDSDGIKNNLLTSGEKYIIVHNKTDLVMQYKVPYDESLIKEGKSPYATEGPARPGSLTAGTRPEVDAGTKDLYFTWSSNSSTDSNIYFTPYMRDGILWEFSTKKWDGTDLGLTGSTRFGGDSEEFYQRSVWFKGLASEEVYWETTENDAWRWLVPSQLDLFETPVETASYNIRIEFFPVNDKTDVDDDGTKESCDTCVIYYSSGTTEYRFLTVDGNGNWISKVYNSQSDALADLEQNKLRLYRYEPRDGFTTADSVGPQTYHVKAGTKVDDVVASISYQLTVRDTYRRNIEISCSGTTPKTGYYWLDGDLSTSLAKSTTVQVKFRNDDGTDTRITTLNYHVLGEQLVEYDVVPSGVADANSTVGGNVFVSRDDDGVVTDRVMAVVMNTADGYVRREISVNVGMLSYNDGSTFTADGVTSAAGASGAKVNTKVSPGSRYEHLTLSYQGNVVTNDFTLQIEEVELLEPEYPGEGSVTVDKLGVAAGDSFFSTGIADIELSATGIPETKGVDLIITLDMSGSMNMAISSTDPTERLSALKTSMKELIATLQASNVDFRIAISDFGDLDHFMLDGAVADDMIRENSFFDATSGTDWNDSAGRLFGTYNEFYNHLNFVFSEYKLRGYYNAAGDFLDQAGYDALSDAEKLNYTYINYDQRAQPFNITITKWNKAHDQYVGTAEPNVYTGSTRPDADAFVSVKDKTYAEWCTLIDNFYQGPGHWYGTNYDCGLEYMYRLGESVQQRNIDEGLDREVVAVFMSDGAPMQYNYFSGRTVTSSWAAWFSGDIDPATFQSAAFDKDHRPDKLVELENLMLELMRTQPKALPNVDALIFHSSDAENRLLSAGIVKEDGTAKFDNNSAVRGYDANGNAIAYDNMVNGVEAYFKLENIGESKSLYSAMARNGILIDGWTLERIAQANDYTLDVDTATRAEIEDVSDALLALAKEGKLKYPTISANTRYLYNPNATDNIYTEIGSLMGRPVGYQELVQIARRSGDGGLVTIDGVQYDFREMLLEIMTEVTTLKEGMEYATLSPYHYFYNAEGKNWWAEAIKGDTDKLYPVIDKHAHDTTVYGYHGTVRNNYDSGTGAAYDGKDYIAGYRGLGIPIYTLAMSIGATGEISNEDTVNVLRNISSGDTYAFAAYSGDDLNRVFSSITASVTHAATKGYFMDTMGEGYDLLTWELNGVTPTIEVIEYELDANHNRTGEYNVLETVTFPEPGVAKSSAVFDSVVDEETEIPTITYPDIWGEDGVIRGKYFSYNTTGQAVDMDFLDDRYPAVLDPETFFWNIGTVGMTEQVLSYCVYLSGSDPEDPAPKPWAGDYPTNESAKLYYVDYRGQDRVKDTISPEFPWGKARVGYGFYLVDEDGNPLVNPLTDETGTIENAVKLTRPVYQELIWGTDMTGNRISSRAVSDIIPSGYLLYTPNVNYYIEAHSDGSGAWNFQNDKTGTTYVQYVGHYTNETVSDGLNLDNGETHNTVVWFAVKRAAPLTTDKKVETNGDGFTLTLEAFASGATSQVATVKPADIVLALDQSSSMYTPLGWNKDRVNLEGGDVNTSVNATLSSYKLTDFVSQARTAGSDVQENAKRLGYYIAVHNNAGANFMYLVHYAQNSQGKWGWYYISIDQTTRSIDMDAIRAQYDNPSGDSTLNGLDYKAIVYNNGGNYDLLTNVSYYKTQYGALVESVESFVTGLRQSGVNHRLGIVGFASPCYDGWDHYDGSGLYVNGEFYLYDTDFMYKGTRTGGTLTYTDAGFVEENWSGDVILDPNKTFHATSPVTTALDSETLAHAYSHSIVVKDAQGNPTGQTMYPQALVDVSTEDGYSSILNSIDAINANYQQTCPSVGIEMAEKIFAARSAETSARDKIIVLFTDGVPTVRLYSNREHGFSDDLYAKSLYWTISGGVEDALDRAVKAKENGVEIYTVGTAAMQNATIGGTNIDSGDFLNYLSSNYANVAYEAPAYDMISTDKEYWKTRFDTNRTDDGGEGSDKDPDPTNPVASDRMRYYSYYNGYGYEEWTYYYKVVPQNPNSELNYAQFASTGSSAGNDLDVAFGTVMDAITVPTVRLDKTAKLRDVLSKYFDLKGNDTSAIRVYTAPFLPDGTVGEKTPLAGASVRLDKTDITSDRYDIIDVIGYDYQSEYYSSAPRSVNGADYYGSKLIVEIDVLPREGFWGGNNVPTNDTLTGIYDNDGTRVQEFPVPEVNVAVKPEIQAQDQVVYYGEKNIDAMDLYAGVTMDGLPVTYDEATGIFHPAQDWMDDYAQLNWSADTADVDYCHPATLISGTVPGSYTFGVTMTPRPAEDGTDRTGTGNITQGDGNIAGTPIVSEISDSAVGKVQILVPLLTYRDSNIQLGDETNYTYYTGHNLAGDVQWLNMEDPYGRNPGVYSTVPSPITTEPGLAITYTPAGKFNRDTMVNVEITLGSTDGENITEISWFDWLSCPSDYHDGYENVKDDWDGDANCRHSGATVSHEFTIHVIGGENGMTTNKVASLIDGANNKFKLTLDAYATGSNSTITITKPSDIVLVLDHSASMRTPAGAPYILDRSSFYNDVDSQIPQSQLDKTLGEHIGYYIAHSKVTNAWFVLRYVPATNKWEGFSIPDTECFVNPNLAPNPDPYNTYTGTQHTQKLTWDHGKIDSNLVFYKTQYAMLYDAIKVFVSDLKDSGVEHNVAIVGFAGRDTYGTRVYVGGTDANGNYQDYKSYDYALYHPNTTQARRDELYRIAMKNVQDEQEFQELDDIIEMINTNDSYTCPTAGLQLADEVYAANPINTSVRDRVVVLFTDGIPNRTFDCLGNGDQDANGVMVNQDYIYNDIVTKAYETKHTYGAKIHAISTTTLGAGANRDFLKFASSDYPNATSYTTPGEPLGSELHYTTEVDGEGKMSIALGSVTEEVSGTTVSMDDTTVMMEILTDYVELENPEVDVSVYKQYYLGNGVWGDKVQLFNDADHEYYRLSSTEGDVAQGARIDVVEVYGFHYSQEYISDVPRTVDGKPYYGSRLVAEVIVTSRDGFWGGNNVPTNEASTGLYANGQLVETFPIPEVNMPISPDIKVENKVVYYGDKNLDASDLFTGITVNGVEVTYDPATGKFLPPEGMEWVDDFADLSFITAPGYSNLTTDISSTQGGEYTFGVNMKPKTDGSSNMSQNPSNIMGTPVPGEGINVTDTAKVDILVPVLTFKDSEILLGSGVDADYYNATNRVEGIQWVNKGDIYGTDPDAFPTEPSQGFDTQPELELTYTPENEAGDYFTSDTPVDVQVTIQGGVDITGESYFAWDDCHSGRHDLNETPTNDRNGGKVMHNGATDSREFTIHVLGFLSEDTVVIDFGLGVNISILLNDILPENSTLCGVEFADTVPALFTSTKPDFEDSAPSTHGSLTHQVVDGQSVLRYVLKDKNMQMNGKEVFVYAVACTIDGVTRYYYSTVTVIPATVIYYEDNFVSYSYGVYTGSDVWQENEGGWTQEGNPVKDTQQEDRPGTSQVMADANNIYGYDDAYTSMTTYSNGSAMWTTVDANRYANASFVFWGTGFDVVSLTDANTGVILVQVKDTVANTTKNYMVDTYYGYHFTDEGKWEASSDAADTLYQVPVIKVETGVYSRYEVKIVASYGSFFDHGQNDGNGSYNFWLDAIRIYNPAGKTPADSVISGAYDADGELNPVYHELRNKIIGSNAFGELTVGTPVHGVVFIDGNKNLGSGTANGGSKPVGEYSAEISEYANYGPNNELYLAPGQAVVFNLGAVSNRQRVHLALKSVGIFGTDGTGVNNDIADGGGSASVEIYGLDADRKRTDLTVGKDNVIATATDLYYDITALAGKTVVIRNSGEEGILSITNIKTTSPSGEMIVSDDIFTVEAGAVNMALEVINDSMVQVPVEPETPEAVFKPAGVTLGFEEEVKIHVYFNLEGVETVEMGLITFAQRMENGTVENADAVIPGAAWNGTYYMVSSNGIPAKNMGDDVWFRMYARLADGSYVYSSQYHYSPLDYANSILNNSDREELKALVVAMLNYGAAAQTHFSYRTDALMNAGLTVQQQALVEAYREDMVAPVVMASADKKAAFPATADGFIRMAPSVTFGGAFSINYYFQPAFRPDNGMTLYYWDRETYESTDVLTADNATGTVAMTGDTLYSGSVTDIAAKNMDDSVYVAAIYEADGVTYCSGVVSYSLGQYCVNRAAAGNALAAATAVYGFYAKSYFQS